jgi:hypothetical protein
LSYDSTSSDTYSLTGASTKGTVTYAIADNDPNVYQKSKTVGAAPTPANDATDYSADDSGWSIIGG